MSNVLDQIQIDSYVVYPAHGVGKLIAREKTEVAGQTLNLFVIEFERERMTLRLPEHKALAAGLRPLSTKDQMTEALSQLTVKTRAKKAMWSRRAQEYEAKINSGDPATIAQVVRELFRAQVDNDQSYSERQIYQAALDRLVREFALVENLPETQAAQQLETIMKSAA